MTKDQLWMKALKYDMLAQYYKYVNPSMHVYYYQKHLKYMNRTFHMTRQQKPEGYLRFIHAHMGDQPVDIYINGYRILQNVPFKKQSTYYKLPVGRYHIDVYPTGQMVSVLVSRRITVGANDFITLAIFGVEEKPQIKVIEDNPDTNKKSSKLRLIHLAPNSPELSISVEKGETLFKRVPFKGISEYLDVSPMTVSLVGTVSGTNETILEIPNLTLEKEIAYSIVIVGTDKTEQDIEAIILKGA